MNLNALSDFQALKDVIELERKAISKGWIIENKKQKNNFLVIVSFNRRTLTVRAPEKLQAYEFALIAFEAFFSNGPLTKTLPKAKYQNL